MTADVQSVRAKTHRAKPIILSLCRQESNVPRHSRGEKPPKHKPCMPCWKANKKLLVLLSISLVLLNSKYWFGCWLLVDHFRSKALLKSILRNPAKPRTTYSFSISYAVASKPILCSLEAKVEAWVESIFGILAPRVDQQNTVKPIAERFIRSLEDVHESWEQTKPGDEKLLTF